MNEAVTPIRAIFARRELLRAEVELLRGKIAEFEQELGELETAARVLMRLGVADMPDSVTNHSVSADTLPSLSTMIFTTLDDLAVSGVDPVERSNLTKEIIARWPNVNITSLRQTIWRLGNEKKIDVAGDLVYRKTTLPAPTQAEELTNMAGLSQPTTFVSEYPFAADQLKEG